MPGQQSKGAVVIMKHVETELQGFSVSEEEERDLMGLCSHVLALCVFSYDVAALSYVSHCERKILLRGRGLRRED